MGIFAELDKRRASGEATGVISEQDKAYNDFQSKLMVGDDQFAAVQEDLATAYENTLRGEPSGIPEGGPETDMWGPIDLNNSLVGNLAKLVPGEGGSIEAGIGGLGVRAGEFFDSATRLPETIAEFAGAGDWWEENAPDVRDYLYETGIEPIFGNREAHNQRYSQHSWGSFKEGIKDKNTSFMSSVGDFFNLLAAEGPAAAIDGVVAVAAPYLYGALRTAEMTEDREENTGESANTGDVMIAAGQAALNTFLERIPVKSALRGTKLGDYLTGEAASVADGFAKRVAKGASKEALTEFLQEYSETVSTNVQRDFSDVMEQIADPQALDNAIAGAVIGGGVGGAMGGLPRNTVQTDDGPDDDEATAVEATDPTLPGEPGEQLELPLDAPQQEVAPREEPTEPAAAAPTEEQLELPLDGPAAAPVQAIPDEPQASPAELPDVGFNQDSAEGQGELEVIAPPTAIPEEVGPDAVAQMDNAAKAQRRAQSVGATLRKKAISQYVADAVTVKDNERPVTRSDSLERSPRPQGNLERLVDNLARLSAVAANAAQGGPLVQESKRLQQLREDIVRIVTNESTAQPKDAIVGSLMQTVPTMERLGLPGKALAKAARGRDPAAVADAIGAINAAATRQLQKAEADGLNMEMPTMDAPPSERRDPKVAAYMRDAEQRGRVSGRSTQPTMTPEEMHSTTDVDEEGRQRTRTNAPKGSAEAQERREAIKARDRSEQRRKLGTVTDYTMDGQQYQDELAGEGVVKAAQPVRKLHKRLERGTMSQQDIDNARDDLIEEKQKLNRSKKTAEVKARLAEIANEIDSLTALEFDKERAGYEDQVTPSNLAAERDKESQRTKAPASSDRLRDAARAKMKMDERKKSKTATEFRVRDARLAAAERSASDEESQQAERQREADAEAERLENMSEEEREAEEASKVDERPTGNLAKSQKVKIKASGPIKDPVSGASKVRLKAAEKVYNAYKKRNGKKARLLHHMALEAKRHTVPSKGLGRILVANPAEPNLRKALVAVEGAYPKRTITRDEKTGKITKLTRATPRKPGDKSPFSALKNREFYWPEDVEVIRGRRVDTLMVDPKSQSISVTRKELPSSDRTIMPEESDRLLREIMNTKFNWGGGKVDELAMLQYLLEKDKPGKSVKRARTDDQVIDDELDTPTDDPELDFPEDVDDADPIEMTPEEIEEFVNGIAGGTSTADPDQVYETLSQIIKQLEMEIAAAKIELPILEEVARQAPVVDNELTVQPHAQWPWANEFESIYDPDTNTVSDFEEMYSIEVKKGKSVDSALVEGVMIDAQSVIEMHEKRLADLEKEREKANEDRIARPPSTRPKKKGGEPTEGPTDGPDADGTPEDGGDGRTRGDVDPSLPGRIVIKPPNSRPPTDLYESLGPSNKRIAAFIKRAAAYQFSGSRVDDGLNAAQVRGVALLLRQWEKARKAGTGGFLNIDGTGLGKTRQVVAGAQLIASREEELGGSRPVLLLVPGANPNDRKAGNTFKKEARAEMTRMGIDPDAKYSDGSPKFIWRNYSSLQNEKGTTEYAAVLADEAHAVKGSGKEAQGFDNLNTPFRSFFTATPTDRGGQELYYLKHILRKPGQTVEQSMNDLIGDFQLQRGEDNKGNTIYRLPDESDEAAQENYIVALNRALKPMVEDGALVSRTYGRNAQNFVTTPTEIDNEAAALYDELLADGHAPTDAHMMHLTEHMKLPYMIDKTIEMARAPSGFARKTIAVFRSSNPSDHSRLKGTRFAKPALDVYVLAMAEADIPGVELRGDSKASDESVIENFQGSEGKDGPAKYIAITDQRGATGLNLNDKWGDSPRHMLIAMTGFQGERFMQLLGRHDRANNRTVPYTEFVRIDNDSDRAYRQNILPKIVVQEAVAGVRQLQALNPGAIGEQIYENEEFKRRQREALAIEDSADATVNKMVAENASARDIIKAIVSGTDNSFLGQFGEHLLTLKNGWEGVQVIPLAPDTEARGDYNPKTGVIRISPESSSAQTLMHELTHHFTAGRIRTDMLARNQINIMRKALSETKIAERFPNALRNADEFVSEFFTDPEFQEEMRRTYIGGGKKLSVFDRFVRAVHRLLGVTDGSYSVTEKMIELDLFNNGPMLDFDSMPLHRLRMPAVGSKSGKMAKQVERWSKDIRNRQLVHTGRKAMLWTMTYDQIAETYKALAERTVQAGRVGGNILADLVASQESIAADANRFNLEYEGRVIKPLRKFATGPNGSKMMTVRMSKDGKAQKMTQLEYLSRLMNISGEAGIHFGEPTTSSANTRLGGPKNKKVDPTAKAAWDLHAKNFNDPDFAEAAKVYKDLARFFKKQQGAKRQMLGRAYLDTLYPDEKVPWSSERRTDSEVNKKLESLGNLSEKDLKELGGTQEAVDDIRDVLQPGVVSGAYFPLRRYGDYVVVADGEQDYNSDAERDALLAKYPFAKDDAKNSQVKYKIVSRFESEADASTYKEELDADFKDNDYIKVKNVMLRAESAKAAMGSGSFSGLMQNFSNNLSKRDLDSGQTKTMQTIFAQTLLDMVPETSVANAMRERKGIAGASVDIMKVLQNEGASQGYLMANLKHSRHKAQLMQDLNGHVRGMDDSSHLSDADPRLSADAKAMEQVRRELMRREEAAATKSDIASSLNQKISDVGFLYYLVGASYNLVNATQVPLVTGPYLSARYGAGEATKALAGAYRAVGGAPAKRMLKTGGSLTELRNIFSGKDFNREMYDVMSGKDGVMSGLTDQKHKDMMQTLVDEGHVEASLAMDMSRGSERSHVDAHGKAKGTTPWNYLTDWMRMAPHTIEVMNRSVTAVAAFDLEYAKSKNYDKALVEARKAVKQTQFVYQHWNKPPAFQHSLGRIALMFKQHVQHMYFYMIRNAAVSISTIADPEEKAVARKSLGYFILTHVMAAGAVGGTPELIKWMISLGFWALGDSDEPFEYDKWLRGLAYDLFGDAGATFASHGLPGFLGMSISGRVGIDSMLMFEGIDTESGDTFLASTARLVGGPMISLGERAVKAKGFVHAGQYDRAIENVVPKVVRDGIKSYRYSQEGFKDMSGKTYLDPDDMDWWDFAQTAVGFAPAVGSDTYQSRSVGMKRQKMMDRRARYFTLMYGADNAKERAKVAKKIRQWNRDNPAFAISSAQIKSSMERRRQFERETEKGVYTPKAQRAWAREQQRSY